MKTLKKLFSVSAIVALLGTLAPMYAFGATYSDELQDAYKYAYAHEVTTMTSIDNANMYGNLKRIEMAKMLANYAINVLGMTPDTTKACTFPDVPAALDAQYDNGVTKACQLGLMGVGIENFNPNGTVTRAEFGTAFSRALNADSENLAEMNAATPYYKEHLKYLNTTIGSNGKAIMTDISNPSQAEVRGYVMLMMMRSDDSYSPSTVEGCTATELLACITADDYDACIAACSDEPENPDEPLVVKKGTLNVSAKANDGASIFIEGVSELDTIKLNASEDIDVEKVTLEKYGYVTHNTGIKVWFENEDGVKISNEKTLVEKTDEVTLTIKKDYRNALENKAYTIVVTVDSGYKAAETLGFKVKDVTSSAETLKIASYTPTTYSMVSYNGTNIEIDMKGKDTRYNYEAGTAYQVSKFRVKAGKSEIKVNGFTLTNNSATGLDLSKYIDNVEVKVGDKSLKLTTTDLQKKTLKVSFAGETIEAKGHADFTVYVSLKDNFDSFGDSIQFALDQTAFQAVETKTSARIGISSIAGVSPEPLYTFAGTKVKLENTKLGKVSAPRGKEDVIVAEGTLTLSESVELNPFVVTVSGGIETLELWLNGSLVAEGEFTGGTNFAFKDVVLDKGGKLQFVADLYKKDDTANVAYSGYTSINFDGSFNKAAFVGAKYEESGEPVNQDDIAGSISFANITVENVKGNLENTLTKKVEVIADGTHSRKTVFEGTYTAKKGTAILNELTISGSTITAPQEITFYVTIDKKSIDLDLPAAGNVSDTFSDVTVEAGQSINVKVEADVTSDTTGELNYSLILGGEDEDGLALQPAEEPMVAIKLVKEGSVTISAVSAKDLRLKENNIVLADFTVKAKESGTDLTSFILSGVQGFDIAANNIKVKVDGTELESDEYTLSGGKLTATELNEQIGTNGVKVQLILKNVNNTGDYNIQLTEVNGTPTSKEFSVKVVDALVRFTSQENNQGVSTKYTVSLEKSDEDIEVTALYYEAGVAGTGYLKQGTVTDGMTVSILNAATAAYIEKIEYMVGTEKVSLIRDNYEDYFKVDDEDLIVYSNK